MVWLEFDMRISFSLVSQTCYYYKVTLTIFLEKRKVTCKCYWITLHVSKHRFTIVWYTIWPGHKWFTIPKYSFFTSRLSPNNKKIARKLPGSCCLMKTMKTKTISVCMTLPNLGIIMLPTADENRSFARSLFFYKIYSEYYSSY